MKIAIPASFLCVVLVLTAFHPTFGAQTADIFSDHAPTGPIGYRGLPAGYTQVDSITSSGAQTIDTGIIPDTATAVDCNFGNIVYSGSQAIFGQNWTAGQYLLNLQSSKFMFHSNGNDLDTTILAGTDYRCQVNTNGTLYLSHGSAVNTYPGLSLTTSLDKNLAIFSCFDGSNKATLTLYGMKIYKNDVLIADLVPAIRDSDTKPGLYDLINEKFLVNTQSGVDFTSGAQTRIPKVNPTFASTGASVWAIEGTDAEYYEWSATNTTGTITIPNGEALVDVLLVGGGGAGGLCRGGGGGGGGVVYQLGQTLAAGTYTIQVGAGGIPQEKPTSGQIYAAGKSPATTCGGDSLIQLSAVTNFIAHGGGGGGNFVYQSGADLENSKGLDGGCGGGAGGHNEMSIPGGAGTEGEGFAGGSQPLTYTGGGGGGGAGGAGGNTVADQSGNGGHGLSVDITGKSVVYGGGGGGGGFMIPGGAGGAGGGAAGHYDEGTWADAGRDGLGGGGGGGGGKDNNAAMAGGGAGGSGIVIIRYSPPSLSPRIASFAVAQANYDTVAFAVGVPTIGTDANSATATIEIAEDESFANLVTNKTKSLTGAWSESAYAVDVTPSETTRYARLIIDNGAYTATSGVVTVNQTPAYTLAGTGYDFSNDGLNVRLLFATLIANSATVSIYLDDASEPSVTTNVTSVGEVVTTFPGVSAASEVRIEIASYGKNETQTFTAQLGRSRVVVANPADHVSGPTAIVVKAGDSVVFPLGNSTYSSVDTERFISLDGNVVTALDAGIANVIQNDALGTTLANVVLVIEPEDKAADGRTFIYNVADNRGWSHPASWTQVGVAVNEDYPNAATDLAYIPVTGSSDITVSIAGTNTVQDLYIGRPETTGRTFRLQGASAEGNTLKIVGVRSPDTERPGKLMFTSSASAGAVFFFNLGGAGASNTLLIPVESDLDFDFGGPLAKAFAAGHNDRWTRSDMKYCIFNIASNATLNLINGPNRRVIDGDGQQWGAQWYNLGSEKIRGFGVFRIAMSGVFSDWGGAFRFFEGTFVNSVRGNVVKWNGGRGACYWSNNADASNLVLRTEGFTAQISQSSSVGVFAEGTGHSYGTFDGSTKNNLALRGMEFAGGFFEVMGAPKAKTGFSPVLDENGATVDYEMLNLTRSLTVDGGFSYLANNWSGSTNNPIVHFCASNLVHQNDGTLYVIDARTSANDVTKRAQTEIHGVSDYYVGHTGVEDTANDVFPIIPWMITRAGSSNKTHLWWAFFDSDSIMRRGGTRTNIQLSNVTGSERNAYCADYTTALTNDVTVNSLALKNNGKEQKFGVDKTLTVTSGGLILIENGTAIGTAAGAEQNGALSFPNRAYIYATSDNTASPNAIWAPITAPHGLIMGYNGYLVLGGDQTGIDRDIVLNNGTTWLGAKDGTGTIAIDVPVKLIGGNTKLVLTRANVMNGLDLYLQSAGDYSPKVELSTNVNETCNKFFVDGVTLPHGVYGATGSGAEFIDDEHFSGTGTLEVMYDELGTPILNDFTTVAVNELDASFTITAAKGGGASSCDLYSIATKVSDGSALTNLFATITADVENFPFVVSNLEDGVVYDVVVWAQNTKEMSGETYHFEAVTAPSRITTYAIDYTPELSVDATTILTSAATATIPWNLRSKGYNCELTSLKILYGLSADALTNEKPLDPSVETGNNTASLDGLLSSHTYYAKIIAVNNKNSATGETAVFSFTTLPAATVTGDGNELRRLGEDYVAVFSGNGTIKIPETLTAHVLLVGGGGAGGRWQGGGGGGGQVVELSELALTPGEYTINVGGGGVPTDNAAQKHDTSNGGISSIVQNEIILAQAKGGGAGGNYNNTASIRNGSDGANGGGGSYGDNNTSTGAGGQPTLRGGFTGGASGPSGKSNVTAGGGAGAGGNGFDGDCPSATEPLYAHAGDGGPGVASDITGTSVFYGGGGGGGVSSRDNQYASANTTIVAWPGNGGQGGGGQGGGGNNAIGSYQWATPGVDGLGGGGGGGARYNNSTSFDTNFWGTVGGCGTVIIRFSNTEREPVVSVKETARNFDHLTLSVSLDYAGFEKSSADLFFACGTNSNELVPALLQSGVVPGSAYEQVIANPAAGATYYYKAYATNAWGRSSALTEGSLMTIGDAAGTGGTVTRQGDYIIQTFTSDGTLTLPNNVEAEVLVLAGGGAGGHNRGGGGGAGGLIYRRGVKLAGGSYTVTVGAGGAPVISNNPGGNGGDSVLSLNGDELFHAVGGGGGGNFNQGDHTSYAASGASSGGNARRTIVPMAAIAGQGHMGAIGVYGADFLGGGGGGAGERGHESYQDGPNLIRRGGAGGDGCELAISGDFHWYAGGGGGGVYNKRYDNAWGYTEGGRGGRGGGGTGAGSNGLSGNDFAFNAAESGVDGFGGGGGGGSHGEANSAPAGGGAGGSGVVVVRYYAPENGSIGTAPVVEIRDATGNDNATITLDWKILSVGANAQTCTLTARYGLSTNALTKSAVIAVNASGEGTATLKGVKPGEAYYVALDAVNDRAVEATAVSLAKVTIPNLVEYTTTRMGGASGLLQARLDGSMNWSDSLVASDTLRREYGAVMGYISSVPGKSGTWEYTSPIDGFTNSWASLTTFGYQGYIYLTAGSVMRFGFAIDDYAMIKIDGQMLYDIPDSCLNATTYYVAEKTGWHPIEVRFGNSRSIAGRTNSGDLSGAGFGYSGAVAGSKNRAWAWYQPMDEGSLHLLRTGPEGRGFDAEFVSDVDGIFTARLVSSASTSSSDVLYACWGETAAGDTLADWDHSEAVTTLGSGVATNTFARELTDAQAFVRFCTADAEGNVAWSKTFVRDVFKTPRIAETHIIENLGPTVVFGGSLDQAGDTNVVMTLHYGTSRNDPTADILVTTQPNADGTFSITVNGLVPSQRYYYFWTAESPAGGSDSSAGRDTLVTAGNPAFSVWYDTRNQRRLEVHVEISDVGAGGEDVISLGIRKYDRKNSAAYTYVDALTATEPGEYVLTWDGANDVDFGEFRQYRINLKNGIGSTTYENNSDGSFVFDDRLTYVWTGLGGDGKWNNSANWSEATGNTDTRGWPTFLSDVVFPSGCNAEVVLTEPMLQIHSLVFEDGAVGAETRVRITGTPENGFRVMRRRYGDFGSNGYTTFGSDVDLTLDGAQLVIGDDTGNVTLGARNTLTLKNKAALSTSGDFSATGAGTTITVESQSVLASYTHMRFGGENSCLVIDDAEVMVHHAEYRFYANANNAENVKIVFKGRNPRLWMPRFNATSNNGNGARSPTFQFNVPLGGFATAPIRKFNQTKQSDSFPCDTGNNPNLIFMVDPASPALADKRTVSCPIFDCINGFTSSEFTLTTATGLSWAWSDFHTAGKDTLLSLTVAGQGATAVTPADVQTPIVRAYGPYTIYTYADVTKPGVFTAAADTAVDYLMVAGGGAGGWSYPEDKEYSSAGGGAGGFHEANAVAVVAGSYIVNVGRGGDNRPWDKFQRPFGENGYDSSVFGYRVYGGGGGAGLSREWNASCGQYGGSGGGACNGNTTIGKAVVAGDGYNGGSGVGENYGAGGGGAGGVGKNGKSTSVHGIATMNGDGGPGVTSDISGETRVYAGGGGASATSRRSIGGSASHGGGCGGDRWANARGGDGAAGTGGGGGGGAWSREEWLKDPFVTWGQISGGKGGDGCIVIRTRTESATSVPYVAFRAATAAKDGATIEWEYLESGDGATATGTSFDFVFTDAESGLAYTNTVAAGLGYGVYTNTFGGLKSGTTYTAAIVAKNDAEAASPASRAAFTVTTVGEKADGPSLAGLIEGSAVGTVNNQSFDIRAAADAARQLGVVMADRRGDYVSPIDGHVSYWEKKKTYGYSGYMFMKSGVPYSFVGCFVYVNSIKVNGELVFNRDEETPYSVNDFFTPKTDGWYPIEIRIGTRDSDWWGPYNSFFHGVAWSTNAVRATTAQWEYMETQGWEKFMDPGDGSLLRTAAPKTRELAFAGAIWNSAQTELTASVVSDTDGVTPLEVVACFGTDYGDEDISSWTTNAVGVIAADATSISTKLMNLPATGYLRFMAYFLDAEGNRTGETVWTESIYLTEFDEHELEVPSVTLGDVEANATGLVLPVTIISTGSETNACDIVIEYGTTAALGSSMTVSGLSVGAYRLELPGLMPLGAYFVRIYATNTFGESEKSATKSANTPALVEEESAVTQPGLYQSYASGNWNTAFDILAQDNLGVTRGAYAAHTSASTPWNVILTNGETTTTGWDANRTFGYVGYMYLTGDELTVGAKMDDNVRLLIDGDTVIDQSGSIFSYSKYQPTRGPGWYPIEIRVGNGIGGYGPYGGFIGLGWNTTGYVTGDTSASWNTFIDPGDASLLATTPMTRKPTVTSYSISSDTLTANLSFGEKNAFDGLGLYIAYGPAYGGIDTNAWANIEKVDDFDAADTGTEYSGLSGLGSSVRYVRFFFRDGPFTNWSQSILLGDLETPQLDNASAAVADLWKGDRLTVNCALLYDAGAAVTVAAEISRSGDFTDVQSWSMAEVEDTGHYTAAIYEPNTNSPRYIVPGATVSLRFRATGANDKNDVTDVITFTPSAASAFSTDLPTLTATHNTITAKSSLAVFGAHKTTEDGTYVRAYAGQNPQNLVCWGDPVLVTNATEASVTFDVDAIGVPWFVQLEYSNACSTVIWTGRSATATITPIDAATYTWTGLGTDSLWSNPQNWSASSAVSGGYPRTTSTTAVFGDSATGSVILDAAYTIGALKLNGAGSDITFVSLNMDLKNGSVQASGTGGSRDSKWTVDGCTLRFTNDNWGWGTDSKPAASNNIITVTNGGSWISNSKMWFVGDDNTLVIENGALFQIVNGDQPFYLGGNRSKIVVDDATFSCCDVLYFNFGYAAEGERLVLRGRHPIVKVRNDLQINKAGDVVISFTVPKGGYAEGPICPLSPADTKLQNLFSRGVDGSKFYIQIDSSSTAYLRSAETTASLIDWRNANSPVKTIDTSSRVELVPTGHSGCGYFWTYGSTESEVPDGNPTGLKVTIRITPLVIYLR
jgi:hypothetical protein